MVNTEANSSNPMMNADPAEMNIWEASWRFATRPLDSEATALAILSAVGSVVPMEPVRYDLNHRGQWRAFEQRRFIVDILTQRTQIVTLAEEADLEDGGTVVLLVTGKHGEPPQVVARWWQGWPADAEEESRWLAALSRASAETALEAFALWISGEKTPRIVATDQPTKIQRITAAVGAAHHEGAAELKIWSYLTGATSPPGALAEAWE